MKQLLLRLRASPWMLTLLSLGLTFPRSLRVVKVPISPARHSGRRYTSPRD